MQTTRISCPKCNWEPTDTLCRWICDVCATRWNTFETRGVCPTCHKQFIETRCPKLRGGCGQLSLHTDWYNTFELSADDVLPRPSVWFWKNRNKLPITENDRQWIEQSLLYFAEIFEPRYFKNLPTITPADPLFNYPFTGIDDDAIYVFNRLIKIMNVDAWETRLMFYSNSPTAFSDEGFVTPLEKIKDRWTDSSGWYIDRGAGHKEIWLELEGLKDPAGMITTLAHELSHYKLLVEHQTGQNNELLTDLMVIAFGLGIFKSNSYFKFTRWKSANKLGWQMQKKGYLPEQVMAYAMAWLAHYRNEDTSWKKYLNKTVLKYFEQSHRYIEHNRGKVLFE